MHPKPQMLFLAVVPLLFLVNGGCVITHRDSREAQTDSQSVELGKAEMVNLDIEFAAGDLKVEGGAEKLLEADWRYGAPGLKPEVRYEESSFRGRLSVRRIRSATFGSNNSDQWNMRLNEQVPFDVQLRIGAGDAKIDLSTMKLRGVDVHMGAGRLRLDLNGNYQKNFPVKVRGGVGEVTLKLPKDVGVQAKASGGIGQVHATGLDQQGSTYTNRAFGKSKVTIAVDVQGGVGQINLVGE
jgi:hypothetical protein